MKKKNITGIIGIAIFVIGIVAALVIYKKVQTISEKTETGEEADTIIPVSYTHLKLCIFAFWNIGYC